jgi:hypothetical protein
MSRIQHVPFVAPLPGIGDQGQGPAVKAFTPQDVPSLCVALDLMSDPRRRRAFSGGNELPAVAQRLDVAAGISDRRWTGIAPVTTLD